MSLGESASNPERLWTAADGRVFIDTYPDMPGSVTVGTIRLGDVRRDVLLDRDGARAMALAILTASEPKWVEWGMRIEFPASGVTRYTYQHSTERVYWEREVEASRRESAEDGDRITYALVRRAGYELPDGGSYTTGWAEVAE